jgi:hypothetical protein
VLLLRPCLSKEIYKNQSNAPGLEENIMSTGIVIILNTFSNQERGGKHK